MCRSRDWSVRQLLRNVHGDCKHAEVEKSFTMLMVSTKMIQQWPRLNTCLIQDRNTQTIPYFRSDCLKNYPFWPHAYLYTQTEEVPP